VGWLASVVRGVQTGRVYGYAFAMLIGVVTGTYSSIFVAAPVLIDLARKRPLGAADTDMSKPIVRKQTVVSKA
jgi:SecD/SecF fusion protein